MSDNNPYNTEFYSPSEKPESAKPEAPIPPAFHQRNSQSHIWIGFILLLMGAVFLLKRIGVQFPSFMFSWQMMLIVIGIFVGVRKNFQGAGWLILILIGALFLVNEYFLFGELRKFILPIILIGSGLFFIMRPKRTYEFLSEYDDKGRYQKKTYAGKISSEEFIDATSIFGGTKKKVLSKNFKGGDLVNVFGGSEIDLLQADFSGTAVFEVTAIFGGATLLVPANWNVISDAVAILGEVKDKRITQNNVDTSKTLLLKGTVIFGGIDIKSF